MLKTSTLVKIYLSEMFKTKPGKNGKKSNVLLILLIMYIFYLVLMSFIYRMSFNTTFGENPLTKTQEVLLPPILTVSIMSFFFTLIGGNTLSIGPKEMNIIAPLPIKEGQIVTAKLIVTIIFESVYEFMIGFSTFVAMLLCDYSSLFSIVDYLSIIIVTFFSTMVPITLTSFLFLVIAKAVKRSKHAQKIETLFYVLLILAILVGSFTSGYSGTTTSLIPLEALDFIPFVFFIKKAIETQNLIYLLFYLASTVGLFTIFIILFKKFAYRIMFFGKYNGEIKKTIKTPYKKRSMLKNLLRREFGRFSGSNSSIFVPNVLIPPLIMPLMTIIMVFMPDVRILFTDVSEVSVGAIIILVTTILSSLASSSPAITISLDWRLFWILKSTPIKTKDILLSKIIFNLSIIGFATIPLSILFIILGYCSFIDFIFILIFICVAGLTYTLFELYVGLKHPRTGVDDQYIIKQSPAILICLLPILPTLIINAIIFIIPLFIPVLSQFGMIPSYISLILFTALYGLLWLLLILKKGEKLYFNIS